MSNETKSDKHTPGPWNAIPKNNSRYWEVLKGDGPACIAEVFGHDDPAANARLIAAAPDLLEAVERLDQFQAYFSFHAHAEGRMPGNDFYSDLAMEIVKLGRAAIAKARGEQVPS